MSGLVPCTGGLPGCETLVQPGRTCRYCKAGDPVKRKTKRGRYIILPLAPISQKASRRIGAEVVGSPADEMRPQPVMSRHAQSARRRARAVSQIPKGAPHD